MNNTKQQITVSRIMETRKNLSLGLILLTGFGLCAYGAFNVFTGEPLKVGIGILGGLSLIMYAILKDAKL